MPNRTRVKICGITRPEDGVAAGRCGADAIGLVFYAPSPRAVSIEQAQAITQALPPFVTVVGLFVNALPDEIQRVIGQVRLDLLQFHGDEAPADCARYAKPYIKALRVGSTTDVHAAARAYASAQGVLLDAQVDGIPGGTGQTFDWTRVPRDLHQPIILAGGLTPENVAQAIRTVQPYAVDVSGGVEASKGIKDAVKIAQFIKEVSRVESN